MARECSIAGCNAPHQARGWCHTHYVRWRKHGDPRVVLPRGGQAKPNRPCSVELCDSQAAVRGYCNKHYHKWRRYGDPTYSVNRNPGSWRPNVEGYMIAYRPDQPGADARGMVRQHRLVMEEALGRPLRPGETVHHKNGLRHDNRLSNLELWVSKHTPGQRVADLVAFAKAIERDYPEYWTERY